jgi:hypothetical protein
MRAVSLFVVFALTVSPALAQDAAPIRASLDKAARTAAEQTAARSGGGQESAGKGKLFWSGMALGVAGVTTSVLGLTAFRTEDSSTGNAPKGTYQACVAQRDSSPIYASNQCDALKAKNLTLLWGGVAIAGVGAALMIGGANTSAELSYGSIGLFHRLHF